jgi:hypothetical protein
MMKLSRRLGSVLLLAAAAIPLAGCSQAKDDQGEGTTDKAGQLALPLTTQGASGVTYRLRDATFVISGWGSGVGGSGVGGSGGATTTVVSSEDDPDAPTISVSLEEGQHYLELQPGWHFEKITPAGAEEVEATLLSGNPQWVWVSRRSTSFAEFHFGLGEREIWLNGELNLGVVLYEDPSEIDGGTGGAGGFTGTGGAGGFAGTGGIGSGGAAGAFGTGGTGSFP